MPKKTTGKALRSPKGLTILPPYHERGDEPLFRVIYIIDVGAANPLDAARQAYRLMDDPESQPPVLEVIDHRGGVLSIDLSEERPRRQETASADARILKNARIIKQGSTKRQFWR